MTYLGVDAGKETLVAAQQDLTDALQVPCFSTQKISNTLVAIETWLEELPDKDSVHVIFEATGTYSHRLAYCLDLANVPYSILNPKQSSGFAQSMKIVSQNDERDAILLCLYGQKLTPERSNMPNEDLHHLRQKRSHLSSLMRQKQVVDNQLHALSFDPRANTMVKESLDTLQEFLTIQIQTFKEQLYHLDDDKYKQFYDKLLQIKGIGPASASALIVATNGFENFENVKQVCKFLGTIPKSKDSGISVKIKGRIIKTGVPYVRAILYIAAKSAKRYNLACKELYERLRKNGKPHKVAMIAVVNKLIKQAFAIIKNNLVFDNNFACAK